MQTNKLNEHTANLALAVAPKFSVVVGRNFAKPLARTTKPLSFMERLQKLDRSMRK